MEVAAPLLREVLKGLEPSLASEFARGRVWNEADLHFATLSYLRAQLTTRDPRWFVGAQHGVSRSRPDIVCYYQPDSYVELLRDPSPSVRAVVELKFAASPQADLAKLRRLQRNRPWLAWMVYGDHFCPGIHRHWAAQQEKRAASIRQWQRESPRTRGSTILECGNIRATGELEGCADILRALNESGPFWRTDRTGRRHRAASEA